MIAALLMLVYVVAFLWVVGLSNIARGRKYKSGTSWCVWRWTDVDSEYILRLHVLKTPRGAVCLHWIRKPDAEPWLHDHPVSFLSIILRGWYTELRRTAGGRPYHKVNRRFNFIRATPDDRHRIVLVRKNTLTLCFMGPKTREWGFHVWRELCPDDSATPGWIMWKDYYARHREGEDMRCFQTSIDALNAACQAGDHLAHIFNQTYTGVHKDEDVRPVDLEDAAEFVAEAPTGEHHVR